MCIVWSGFKIMTLALKNYRKQYEQLSKVLKVDFDKE